MLDKIQAVKGMNDILPHETATWRYLEKTFSNCLLQYGYQEIRFPLLEQTRLFKRSIGEVTDIVEKEMYTFQDLNGDSLSLRPEGTAGCVRACIEHGLVNRQQQKLWYIGPMFRHEKPQKGRYRQFTHFGVETFGFAGIEIELELLSICYRLWKKLGIHDQVKLEINSLGQREERQLYREALITYFKGHWSTLDPLSQQRLEKNPLRILDSKDPTIKALLKDAPLLLDCLGKESRAQFDALCQGLDDLGIPYQVNPVLVRGLDYYEHCVFEWVSTHLGSQGTLCAGGRYDPLVEQLGGPSVPAVGFAMGAERLLLIIESLGAYLGEKTKASVFFIASAGVAQQAALRLAENLRDKHPDWEVLSSLGEGSFKSQFKKADKSKAQFALILGEEELQNDTISVKNLRASTEQITLSQAALSSYLHDQFIHS